ncbi:hypothetical protein FSHL1_010360 [Fusarium sambucinum]
MLLPPEVVETIPSIPPPTPGGPADHRSERAMGEFLVEGDSDDESLDLPEDMHCPCSECIARFTTNGSASVARKVTCLKPLRQHLPLSWCSTVATQLVSTYFRLSQFIPRGRLHGLGG